MNESQLTISLQSIHIVVSLGSKIIKEGNIAIVYGGRGRQIYELHTGSKEGLLPGMITNSFKRITSVYISFHTFINQRPAIFSGYMT